MRKQNEREYLGHESQAQRMEEHILKGGKGDGMRLLEVDNGNGLAFTVSLDRCADLSRVSFRGNNFGFFGPCGYVAPQFYDPNGLGFLKSFTGGLMTTCGLTNVGNPNVDEGEELPLHGRISHTPAENVNFWTDEGGQHISAQMRESRLFGDHLLLKREIFCPKGENGIKITDTVINDGVKTSPLMLLYHCNMGYPLLTEEAQLYLPAEETVPRDARAAEDADTWNLVLPPQDNFEEQCYYHKLKNRNGSTFAAMYNPVLKMGIALEFDPEELDSFTQWKMMGKREYVMGLEPGNCKVGGRAEVRKNGELHFLAPGESKTFHLCFRMIENQTQLDTYRLNG